MSCGVSCRHGLDLALLCLWHRLAAAVPIRPVAWELPYTTGVALKRKKKKEEEMHQKVKYFKSTKLKGTLVYII